MNQVFRCFSTEGAGIRLFNFYFVQKIIGLQSLLKTNFDSQTRKTLQLDPNEQPNKKLQPVKTIELDSYWNLVFSLVFQLRG